MKKLEDGPKELQDMFAELFKEHLSDREYPCAYKEAYAHFFLKGFDVAMATNGLKAIKPKRTIADVFFEGKDTYALSNDGRLYHLVDAYDCWLPYPDLPQD